MMEIFSKRELVAIFSGKCCMLFEMLVCRPEEEDEILSQVLESMFDQSWNILGWH